MTGATEFLILVNDVLGVGGHEEFSRLAEVEFFRMIAEEFTVNGAPNKTTVSVDIDFSNTKLSSREILIFVNAASVLESAASVINTFNPFLRDGRTTVHDEGEIRLNLVDGLLDFFQNVEVQTLSSGELEGAMRGSNSDGEGVDAGLFNEFGSLFRIGQFNATDDVLFDAAKLTKFSFNNDPLFVSAIDNTLRDLNVLREFLVRSVDHYRAIETGINAVVTNFFSAVIKMNRENGFREDLIGGANHSFEEILVSVGTSSSGNLDNEGSAFGIVVRIFVLGGLSKISTEKAHELFEIVNVIGADRILAIGFLKQFFCRNDH